MSSYICKNVHCSKFTFLDEGWDSYFCAICNTWNEDKCGDPDCYYCTGRPTIPLKKDIYLIFLEAHEEVGFAGVEELVRFYFELEEER